MGQRVAGIAFFKVNGALLPLRGNFTVSPSALERAGIATSAINKIADGPPHVLDLIASRTVDLVINDAKGPREISDDYKIRRAAVEANIAGLTSLDTARALAEALASRAGPPRSLQEYRRATATIAS